MAKNSANAAGRKAIGEVPKSTNRNPNRSTRGRNGVRAQLEKFVTEAEREQRKRKKNARASAEDGPVNPMAPEPSKRGRQTFRPETADPPLTLKPPTPFATEADGYIYGCTDIAQNPSSEFKLKGCHLRY